MRKIVNKLVLIMLAFAMMITLGTFVKAETSSQTDVIEVTTAEELLAINDNLAGHYILTADIDLSSYENWPMIGTYVMDPNSPKGEDPVREAAFTGVFDGNGHTISNVTIDASMDMERMFGVGFFGCVGYGGIVKNAIFQDINVKGMMLVGGVVGYAFECTIDNVDLKATGRNRIESTMVMAGGVIGGLTCSECVNCDVENTDVVAAPGGNSGILGGGFSKPVLENCTVINSTLSGTMEGVPAFGMEGGSWLGGLTGCVNLDDYDVNEWYVKNCCVSDIEITISGKGSYVGGLIGSAGVELKSPDDPRMLISGCTIENVTITVTDSIPCIGGAVGGSFSEGGPLHSFLIDDCTLANVVICTDAEDLEVSQTGMLIGQSSNCQLTTKGGELLDISDRTVSAEEINSQIDARICHADESDFEDAALIGQVAMDTSDPSSDAAEAAALLEAVRGTYEPLFPVITDPQYDALWLDPCAAILGEEAGPAMAEMLKSACNGTIYGQEAVDAFGDGSNGAQFDCLFINGVSTITFDGAVISGADESGNQVFSHEYAYVDKLSLAGMMEGYLYETSDEDAGEFRYFYMMPDTPASTYHLEFRYGSDVDALALYNEGPYAYWLAAGFPVDADEALTENVIELFVLENMDYSAHAPEALAQLNDLGFVGAWQADMSSFGEEYASVDLSMTIDENGHGITTMNGTQTADFEAFAADTGEKGDGQGLYVAYSNLEGEAESAPYTFSMSEDGQFVLTLTADDGVISWVKTESVFAGGTGTAEDPWQIATAEQLLALSASVNDGSAYGYPGQFFVLTADIDLKDAEWQPIGHMDLTDMSNYSCMFMGTLDGQGHTVSNVAFYSDYPVCGVGVVGMNLGEVKNLTVQNVDIRCEDTYSMAIGVVVGYNMGVIHDVTLTGENSIAGVNAIGGIAGGSTQPIWNCTVDGTTIHVLGDNNFSSERIIQEDVAECGGLVVGGFFGNTIDNCTAKGTVIAEGNEPVGLGGIAGCLEMMDSITNCTVDVEIISEKGGHAIGGLCGYSGTHSVGDIALATEGIQSSVYPGVIDNCHVTAKMNIPGATHVGGLVGTGLYYYGEETAFKVSNCTVDAEIAGAVTPGAVAGRAVNSVIESCDASVTLDGSALTNEIGETVTMYESGDQFEADTGFAGGSGTKEDPWQIASAEQLNLIRENLAGHYVLIADIDLSGYENWEPIGAFRSLSDAPEDAEVPHPDYAFTGTFDGAGHTISNLTVSAASPMGAGLFGCASGTENGEAYIGNFTLENINVSGFYLVGGAVGLQFMNCKVSDITLQGENKLSGAQGIGGIVGTGFDLISNCTATADITVIGDDGACAGIIAGGTTMSSIVNCEAVGGSIVAEGNATWGFGAICGAPWGAPQITGCKVSGTSITVTGEGNRLVGGLVGFGGTYDPASPAQITGCTVENVAITVSDTTKAVGGLIGGGKEMMEGSDVMSSFEIRDCSVSGSIVGGGEYTDVVVGDPACAVSVDCQSDMIISEAAPDAA